MSEVIGQAPDGGLVVRLDDGSTTVVPAGPTLAAMGIDEPERINIPGSFQALQAAPGPAPRRAPAAPPPRVVDFGEGEVEAIAGGARGELFPPTTPAGAAQIEAIAGPAEAAMAQQRREAEPLVPITELAPDVTFEDEQVQGRAPAFPTSAELQPLPDVGMGQLGRAARMGTQPEQVSLAQLQAGTPPLGMGVVPVPRPGPGVDPSAIVTGGRPKLSFEEARAAELAARGPAARRPGVGARRRGALTAAQRGVAGSFTPEVAALEAQGEAIAAGMARRQDAMNRAESEAQRLQERHEENEEARQRALDEGERNLREARDALARREIDPNRFWVERGEQARIAGALALAVGDFASSIGGGPNRAMEILNTAVERNILAQRDRLQRDERLLSGQERDLGRLYDRFESDRQRDAAARVLHWQAVERELQGVAADTQDQVTQGNIARTMAQVRRQQQMAIAQFQHQNRLAAIRAARARRARQGMTFQVNGQLVTLDANDPQDYQRKLTLLQGLQDQMSPIDRQRLAVATGRIGAPDSIPGTGLINGGRPLEVSERNKVTEIVGAANVMLSALDDMRQLRREIGNGTISPTDRIRAQEMQNNLVPILGQASAAGVMSEGEVARFLERSPNVAEFRALGLLTEEDPILTQLDQLTREFTSRANESLTGYGRTYEPLDRVDPDAPPGAKAAQQITRPRGAGGFLPNR